MPVLLSQRRDNGQNPFGKAQTTLTLRAKRTSAPHHPPAQSALGGIVGWFNPRRINKCPQSWGELQGVALYDVVGGIPAYLRWLDGDLSLVDNIRQVILEPGNIFLAEPELLLHDELRDLSTYQAILRAITP